jgi:AraC-like DNA-binding protein
MAGRTTILRASGPSTPLGRIRLAVVSPQETPMRERPWRYYPFYAAVLVYGGTGVYRDVAGREQPISAGDIMLVRPGFGHWYGPMGGAHWSEVYIVFDGPVFDLLGLEAREPVRRREPIAHWIERIAGCVSVPAPGSNAGALREIWRLVGLLLDVFDDAEPAGPDETPDPIARARRLLEADLAAREPLPRIAQRVGLGYERFRHRFARDTGTSPARYRDAHRIQAACELLRGTPLTHRQIAHTLGYADEFHFSKRFRQATGRSPRAFRTGSA